MRPHSMRPHPAAARRQLRRNGRAVIVARELVAGGWMDQDGPKAGPMRAITRICLALAAFFALAAASPAEAQGIYAALAISPSTGAYGFGYNYDTDAQARNRAMMECKKHAQDCRIYATFNRQCIAVARASNNAFGWAMGYAADERPERALNECASRNGGDCKIVTRFCSGTTG